MSISEHAGFPEPVGYLQGRLPGLWFELHPVTVAPVEGTTGFIVDGNRPRAAIYRDGCWRNGRGDQLKVEHSMWGTFARKAPKREADGHEAAR